MNKKTLLVCFVLISILSLAVSTFAVFVTARAVFAEQTDNLGNINSSPTAEQSDSALDVSDTELEDSKTSDDVTDDVFVGADAETPPKYTLIYSDGILKVTASDGTVLYSRKAPLGKPSANTLEQLAEGITFSDYSSAVSAIYDLIS